MRQRAKTFEAEKSGPNTKQNYIDCHAPRQCRKRCILKQSESGKFHVTIFTLGSPIGVRGPAA